MKAICWKPQTNETGLQAYRGRSGKGGSNADTGSSRRQWRNGASGEGEGPSGSPLGSMRGYEEPSGRSPETGTIPGDDGAGVPKQRKKSQRGSASRTRPDDSLEHGAHISRSLATHEPHRLHNSPRPRLVRWFRFGPRVWCRAGTRSRSRRGPRRRTAIGSGDPCRVRSCRDHLPPFQRPAARPTKAQRLTRRETHPSGSPAARSA